MSASPPRRAPSQPVSMRRDGVLIEVWYLPAGAPETLPDARVTAYPSGGLYIDTSRWRCDPAQVGDGIAGVDARVLHLERVIKTCYGMALVFVRDALAHPYDLTHPGFLLGLLARGVVMDDMGDETPLVDPRHDHTQFTLLTAEQVATTFLSERAARLRILVREGDTPALWRLTWLTPDGAEVIGALDIGVDASEQIATGATGARANAHTTTTQPAPAAASTPADPEPAAEPFDAAAWKKQLDALKRRYQRDADARG